MGDNFWMEDAVRVEWEEAAGECGHIFQELDKRYKQSLSNIFSFMDSQIQEYIFQQAPYPATNTGSQYLDPAWRQNIVKIKSQPTKIQVLISLN